MKKIKKLFMTIGLSVFLIFTSGCGKEYTVTFISEGETYHKSTLKGKNVLDMPNEPTKKGYEFKGWYFDEEYNIRFNSNYYSENEIDEDVSLYARLDLIQYQIVYNLSGGINNGNNPSSYNVTDSKITLLNPYRQGYYFAGWYSDMSFSNKVSEIDPSICSNVSLYAKWLRLYNIEYVLDGGINNENNPSEYVAEGENIVLLAPSKEGKEFIGWYKEATFDTKVTEIDISEASNVTLYAKWVQSYLINYVCDIDCSNTNKTSYLASDEDITLLPAGNSHYRFDGWYSDANFENKVETIDTSMEKNITLYAKWTRINTINYLLYNGENHQDNPLTYLKGEAPITLKDPTKRGYKFLGWYKEASLINKIEEIDTSVSEDITLYAGWEIIPYTINYDLNQGDSNHDDNPSGYTVNSEDITLLDPNKEGYDFLGWYTDNTYETKVEVIEKGTIGNISLVAKWEITHYEINYTLNNGTNNNGNPNRYNVETDDIVLLDPQRVGYKFLGWYTDNTYETKVEVIEKGTMGNITLVASWELIDFTVIFDADGGKVYEASQYSARYNIEEYDVYFPTPYREGYDFMGWYTDETYDNRVESITELGIGNFTLIAKWYIEEYDIIYFLDGGENHPDNPTKYNTVDAATINEPTKKGYNFLGWYRDDDFSNVQHSPQKGDTGNLIFFAKWEIINYVITLDANGGSVDNKPITTYTYNVNNGSSLLVPVRDGYIFDGWYKDDTYTTPVDLILAGEIGDVNLIAKWNIEKYTIIYHLDEGENHIDNPEKYSYLDVITLKNPTKKGYEFKGWYSDADFENPRSEIISDSIGIIEIYAKWELKNYNINYVLNGGENNEDNPLTFTINDRVELKQPTKEGYSFAGWYSEDTFINNIFVILGGSDMDVTLYAKWDSVTYNITYELGRGTNNRDNPNTYTFNSNTIIKDPSRKGYSFAGWYTTDSYDVIQPNDLTNATGDKTFVAKWEIITYTIEYVLNGGTNNEANPSEYTINDMVELNEPTKEGFVFRGWYYDEEFNNNVVGISGDITTNVTLYAKWGLEFYTITYVLNGGENNPDNVNTYKFDDEVIIFYEPTRSGYTFVGWYEDEEFTTMVPAIPGIREENITIYAKWEPISE